MIQFSPNLPQRTSTTTKVSWSSSEFAYFQCNLDGVQTISCGQGETGDMSFPVSEGPHTFSVRGTDRYGNAGEWERYKFVVGKKNIEIYAVEDLIVRLEIFWKRFCILFC